MMKKIFASILLVCIGISLPAEVVSVPEARVHAKKFFGRSAEYSPVPSDRILGCATSDGAPSFYVINNPSGGWMIMSAEDSATPVLAYSDEGSFPTSGFNPATGEWLRNINTGISGLRAVHARPSAKVSAQWASLGAVTKAGDGSVVLPTAKWGQGKPFNNLCPQQNGQNTVTGCVATAMAIVCQHHQWPAQGKGTTAAYTTETNKLSIPSADLSTHSYNWSDMPASYGGSSTATQNKAVASLMYDCGTSVEMDYCTERQGGSGAVSNNITKALKYNFSYSGSIMMIERAHYNLSEWFSIMQGEIDAGRPVIYAGVTTKDEGHAFVCDGYDSNHMLHINWGWEGNADGFFAITWLGDEKDPKVEGNVGHVFNCQEEAFIGIKPDKGGESGGEAAELFLYSVDDISGIMLKSGAIKGGGSFVLDFGYILNNSLDADYSGKVKAVLMDRSGRIKEDISTNQPEVSIKRIADGKYTAIAGTELDCRINGTVAPGDAIAIMYTLPNGSWTRMGGDPDQNTISMLGAYDACFIANAGSYKAKECIYPVLIQGHKAVKKIDWYYDGAAMTQGFVQAVTGKHSLKAVVKFVSGSTETVVHPITVN